MRDSVGCYAVLLPSVINYLPITVTRGYGEDESSKVSQCLNEVRYSERPENDERLRKE